MTRPLLSVLVCAIPERMPSPALKFILRHAAGKPVEVLSLLDNRCMTVGRKRSILLSIAQGDYFAFVDDDDQVSDDYVDVLLAAIAGSQESPTDPGVPIAPPDVICFRQRCIHADTGLIEHCRYSLGYEYRVEPHPMDPKQQDWYGKPAHTMAWRTDLVQSIEFPDGNFGEDVGWVKLACERAKTEIQIDREMYVYRFDPKRSATRD